MNGIARILTVWKLVDGGRWGEEVLRERQEPSARRYEAVDRRGDVQYQNEVVDTTMMEVQRAANSRMGVVAEEWGSPVVLGNNCKRRARLGGPKGGSGNRALGIEGSEGN